MDMFVHILSSSCLYMKKNKNKRVFTRCLIDTGEIISLTFRVKNEIDIFKKKNSYPGIVSILNIGSKPFRTRGDIIQVKM